MNTEELRKEFESHFSESAIQRDVHKPDEYWNTPMQHKWEGFILGRQSAPEKASDISAELSLLRHRIHEVSINLVLSNSSHLAKELNEINSELRKLGGPLKVVTTFDRCPTHEQE